jgi:hypothetical protein
MRLFSLSCLLSLATVAAAGDHLMNKTCPVSGKPVDSSVKTVPFNPKTDAKGKAAPAGTSEDVVGFCCPKCETTYLKDPEKYRGDLEKQKGSAK